MNNPIAQLTEATFDQEVFQSDQTVLVDFWADWCGPCKMLAPVLDEIARDNPHIKISKVNIEDHPALAERFQIQAIPALFLFRDGALQEKIIGLASKKAILAKIAALEVSPRPAPETN